MIESFSFVKESVKRVDSIPARNTTWIHCMKPEGNDIETISKMVNIPKEEFDDVLDDEEDRPRLEVTKKFSIIVYKSPLYEGEEVTTTSLYVYMKDNVIVTIANDRIKPILDIRNRIRTKRAKFLFNKSPAFLLLFLLDRINDEFFTVIDRISDTSDLLKKKVGDFSKKNIERIYNINTTLSYFNRALMANVEVLKSMKHNFRHLNPKDKANLEDVYYDALSLLDTESVQRGIITGLFNIESVMNNYNLNESMKRLTSIMMVLMIPTVITGVYGMNVANLPFAQSPFGFILISSTIMLIIIGSLVFLRKADWV
jgi:magnesium transporter